MGNIDFRDPNVQIAGLVIFVSLIVAFVFFVSGMLPFGFQPRATAIAALEADYEAISADLMKAKQTASRLPQVKAEHDELVARWEEAKLLLPTEKEMAELLTQVTVAGQRSGVDFVLFEPRPPVPRDIYLENPIAVTIEGGYHEIGMFLGRLSNLSRIVNVNRIDMKNVADPAGTELPEIVEASLDLSAYVLMTDQQLAQAQQVAQTAPAQRGGTHGGQ